MKILSRYILQELRPPFFLGFSIFTFILLMEQIFLVLELAVNRGVAFSAAASLLVYSLPADVSVTVPMSLLMAVLMAFGRLSKDNEIIALRAHGIRFINLVLPLITLGLFLSLFMVMFNDLVLPYSNYAYKKVYSDIIRKKAEVVIQPGKFTSDFDDYILYVDKVNKTSGELENIIIFQISPDAPVRTILAQKGKLQSDPNLGIVFLSLDNGQIQSLHPKDPKIFLQAEFGRHDLYLDINSVLRHSRELRKSAREMTISEINTFVKKHAGDDKKVRAYEVELQKKLSLPFACLTFILIGAPLGLQAKRSGRGAGFGLSIILIFLYYIFIISGQILGENGTLTPFVAMWLPNIIIGGAGICLIFMSEKETEFNWSRLFSWFYRG